MSNSSRRTPPGRPAPTDSASFRLEARNLVLLGLGIVAVVAGFQVLSTGSRVAAPLLLIAGFLVLIPWGIIAGTFPRRGEVGDRGERGA